MLVPPSNFIYVEDGIYKSSYIDKINYLFLETLNLRSILLLDVERPPESLYRFLKKNDIQLYQISHLRRMQLNNFSNNSHTPEKNSASDTIISKGNSLKYYDTNAIDSIVWNNDVQYVDPNIDTSNFENEVIYIHNNNEHHYNDDDAQSNIDDSWMIISRNLLSKIFDVILDKRTHNLLIVDSMDVIVSILRKIEKINFSSILTEYRFYADKNVSYKVENYLELLQIELVSSTKFENEDDYKNENLPELDLSTTQKVSNSFQNMSISEKSDIANELNQNSYTACAIDPINTNTTSESNQNSYTGEAIDPKSTGTPYEYKNSAQKIGIPIQHSTSYKSVASYDNSYTTPNSLTVSGSRRPSYYGDDANDLSTSPQIPSNLLRLMDIRKNKLNGTHDAESEDFIPEQPDSYDNNNNNGLDASTTTLDTNRSIEHKSLLSSEFDRFSLTSPAVERSNKYSKYYYAFYKPFTKDKFGDNINPVVKLKLPAEEYLPDWFKNQRDLWAQDYMDINNL